MNKNYHNLRIVDWNFDFARGVRYPIFGVIVSLPEEVGDAFPQYFKAVEEVKPIKVVVPEKAKVAEYDTTEADLVITETESEQLVNRIDEENLAIVTEPSTDALTVQQLFENDIADGKVKESKKYYQWNDKKISKEDYQNATDKVEFLNIVLN